VIKYQTTLTMLFFNTFYTIPTMFYNRFYPLSTQQDAISDIDVTTVSK